MSYWIGALVGLILAPFTIAGYIQMVKKNHIKEITWFVDFLERKEKLNEEEKMFIKEAKDFLSGATNKVLNNKNKND